MKRRLCRSRTMARMIQWSTKMMMKERVRKAGRRMARRLETSASQKLISFQKKTMRPWRKIVRRLETVPASHKSSELSYNQRRKKNIEENKRLLEEVMGGRHPISESLGNKKTPKERVTKNLKAHSDEPAVRRESQRNKVRRYCFNCDISYDK